MYLAFRVAGGAGELVRIDFVGIDDAVAVGIHLADEVGAVGTRRDRVGDAVDVRACEIDEAGPVTADIIGEGHAGVVSRDRSEEHTSELQSLMRISYAVFCWQTKKTKKTTNTYTSDKQ